ncbi:Prolyl tri/tetrapeptidyl aminopeptidase [Amycolatopsis japonica]|uniref:Prolyl tri/tetrapeptidyl aminopeptidase n=1 Tax=Amycolatopsis japonica TaxID=208439 RepID=A0A075UT42_9PSEU|nr:S28 family serine protease [Amycolatopsis japonica]AIG75634.1 Prolyl tri/tetrapeptidyl aminopeptidase [Amycolatopsis japonica]
MRKLTAAWSVLAITVLALAGLTPAAQAAPEDIKEALGRIPGLTVVSENPAPTGYRFFKLTYTQPVDHRRPEGGTFQQRFTLLHKEFRSPTVVYTSGYNVSQSPNRSEPTQIVDGNQLSMEYRFFTPSRPEQPNWGKQLTIWQAAADQHRAVEAFKRLYPGKWLATGGSKGGMTATYFRRFFPDDVDATIPYVAPNDVINEHDRYNRFLANVGNDPACRSALKAIQRDVLTRRSEFAALAAADAAKNGYTFKTVGSADVSLEISVIDSYFAFWQYQRQSDCATIPKAGAPASEVYAWFERVESLNTYSDQNLEIYVPYYFQAAYQLGAPESYEGYLRDLLRYPGSNVSRTFVPKSVDIPRFDHLAMPDIDFWVKSRGKRLMFVYGGNDPWGAEPFKLGFGTKDSYSYTVPGGNHGARISQLPPEQAAEATNTVRRWAGLPPVSPGVSTRSVPAGFPDFDADLTMLDRRRL